jgi:thioredoxin reductase (NADPH)
MITPELLHSIPLFATLKEEYLEELAASAADMHLVAEEWLVSEGEHPAFYVLISGDIEASKWVGGVLQVLSHYHAGDFFGETALLLGSPAVANLRALNEARVLRLDEAGFHDLMNVSEKIAATILQTMTRRVVRLQEIGAQVSIARTLLIGRPVDLECYDLRQFLNGNQIAYRWIDPDNPNTSHAIPPEAAEGPYPLLVLPDGIVLKNPRRRELADRLGLQTMPTRSVYDVVIVGGGPAGLAAAVYGASEGLETLMIEREAPGGQAGTSSRIENYLGFPTGLSGDDLSARALQQARRFGAEIVVARSVRSLHSEADRHCVDLDADTTVQARTILLATGVAWRTLATPGADALVGRGIYYGAARTEALSVRDKDVYLIGGGNSAGQAAMFFTSYARSVTLLIRAASIEAGMSQYLIDQLGTRENISVHLNTQVIAVHGSTHLEAITVQNAVAGTEERLVTDSLFVFIGADAETDWLPPQIARDSRGYLLTGLDVRTAGNWKLSRDPYLLETSVPGIFAAGDVRHGSVKRVASGVGEGSMAIAFIHQYLAQHNQLASGVQ